MGTVERCIHGVFRHVCVICRDKPDELTEEKIREGEKHGPRRLYIMLYRTMEALIERDKECRALRRCLEMERQDKRGSGSGEVMREETADQPTGSDVKER